MTDQIPTQIPPSAGAASADVLGGAAPLFAAGGGPPVSAAADPASLTAAAAAAGGAGALGRPAEADAESAAAVLTSTWQNNKKVNALWSINQNCNSWAGIEGIGWRKLFSGIETSTMALTIIASSALATQGPITYREEPDGMIHEIYAF
jgi:hypothetical protein